MGLTVKEIAVKYDSPVGTVYYYMNKLGLLKKSGSGSKPRRYGKEVVERVGAVLDEVKYKKTISKDADYWKKRSKRVEKSNELLKKKIKAYSELQEKLAQIEILEKE